MAAGLGETTWKNVSSKNTFVNMGVSFVARERSTKFGAILQRAQPQRFHGIAR
jgi:hypothetical protein